VLSSVYKYLAIAGAFVLAIGVAVLKGMSLQKTKTKVAQKEIELDAYKAVHKAEKEAEEVGDENSEKANDGDWSGLNR